jgi:hypothetical protein
MAFTATVVAEAGLGVEGAQSLRSPGGLDQSAACTRSRSTSADADTHDGEPAARVAAPTDLGCSDGRRTVDRTAGNRLGRGGALGFLAAGYKTASAMRAEMDAVRAATPSPRLPEVVNGDHRRAA